MIRPRSSRPVPARHHTGRSAARRGTALRGAAAATVLALTLGACSGGPDAPDEDATSSPTTGTDDASPVAVDLPDSAVGEAAAWVLEVVNGDEVPAEDELTARFAPVFLEQVPADQIGPIFTQLQGDRPWVPVAASPDLADPATAIPGGAGALEVTIVGESGQFLAMLVGLDDDGLVETLFFGLGTDPDRGPAASWEELDSRLDEVGATSSVLVARVEDGVCVPVDGAAQGSDPGAVLPLASVFKLYVLGAVVESVTAGDLAWDDELELTDDVRSLPSGVLQDEPDGTTVTVRDAATGMIAISDNTATDLLIEAVGRTAVEDAQATMGHADPALNVPFPTTRDLFRLGWGDGTSRARWVEADAAGRQAILDSFPDGPLDVEVEDVVTTVWDDGVDWFATSSDVCAAHVWLHEAAGTEAGAPVAQILSENPGLEFDADQWSHVAFKGGSAPGVLAGSWLAEDAEGGTYVVTVQLATADPVALANPAPLVETGSSALALLAEGGE